MGTRHLTFVSVILSACAASNGEPGANSLIATFEEAPGANCPTGGIRLEHGRDLDDNGLLTTNEFTGTAFICDGPTGGMGAMGNAGRLSLVDVVDESAGANCAAGGKRINSGIDDDNDGTLDIGEIDGTDYVCNGSTGASGRVSLINVAAATSGCADGGQTITHGVDDDGDNVLDPGEVDGTANVCNGATPTAQLNALDTRVTTLEGRRVHTATIANGVTPMVLRTSGTWISNVTHPAYGTATVNFAAGTFSSVPTCVANLVTYPGGSAAGSISITDSNANYVTLMTVCTGTTCTGQWDVTFNLLCSP